MKKSNEQVIIRNVLEYSLWTLLLLISVYITYCYSGNLLNNSHPAVITAIILFSVILGLLINEAPRPHGRGAPAALESRKMYCWFRSSSLTSLY